MKQLRPLLLLMYVCFISFSALAQSKLVFKSSIKFATGLRDYKNRRVDSLLLDMYYPPEATSDKKYPVIVFLHGGSFTSGSRTNVSSECDLFAKQGFAVAAVDYRLGYLLEDTGATCNADTTSMTLAILRATQDVNAAFRFLTANADLYSLDTAKFFVGGTSAGATLALYDCYVTDSIAQIYYPSAIAKLGGLQTSGNTLTNTYTVKGICAMWGGMPNLGLITPQSAIPAILFKGGLDTGLPDGEGYYQGCEDYPSYLAGVGIYNATVAAGKSCVYHYNPLGPHAAYDDIFCMENSACFFNDLINGTATSAHLYYYVPYCQ